MPERKPYPRGRPIRRELCKGGQLTRDPGVGPLITRLREPPVKDAIGFNAHLIAPDDGEV